MNSKAYSEKTVTVVVTTWPEQDVAQKSMQ